MRLFLNSEKLENFFVATTTYFLAYVWPSVEAWIFRGSYLLPLCYSDMKLQLPDCPRTNSLGGLFCGEEGENECVSM